MKGAARERIALGICVASAMTGAVFIVNEYRVALVLLCVSLIWVQVAEWLGRGRLFFLSHATVTQIYHEARQGNLKLPAPASYIGRASMVLLVAAIIGFLVR
jgi:hypothetical protein